MPTPGTWLVGAVLAAAAAQTLAHPQYMLSRNKCSSPLAEGTPMMKGRAWATEEPGVAIVAARQALDGTLSVLAEGAAFVAGETLQLGTAGLAQGGLAMGVSHGTFDATDASRSDALPLSIGCDSTRLSNWIGTHIENGVDLTTPMSFPWTAPATCSGPVTVTCAYAHAFEAVSIITPLTLNCCPSRATMDATCGRARKSSLGDCINCLAINPAFVYCSDTMVDGYCQGGH